MRRTCLALILFSTLVSPSLAAEWFEGGTLHQATVAAWRSGVVSDKLATTADWIGATSDEQKLTTAGMTQWQNASASVMACVDDGVKGVPGIENKQASELAILCMQQFKGIYPFLLTR